MSKSVKKANSQQPASQAKLQQPLPSSEQITRQPIKLKPIELLLVIGAAVVFATIVGLLTPYIQDADILYHLGHARLYLQQGLFTTQFPWVQYSVVRLLAADLWYGFHLLLMPFTLLGDPLTQVRLASIFLLAAVLVMMYLIMRRHQMAYPYLWPLLWALSSGPTLHRLFMARPQAFSAALAMLLFSCFVLGSPWLVFVVGFVQGFIHLNLFWQALLLALVVAVVKWRTERVFEWRKLLALGAGLLVGLLCRPNPLGAAKLLSVQIFQLMAEKQKDTGLAFAGEMAPFNPTGLMQEMGPFIALWLGVMLIVLVMIFLRKQVLPARQHTLLWSSLILSVLFFEMVVLVARRSLDMWLPTSVFFIAVALSSLIFRPASTIPAPAGKQLKLASIVIGPLFLLIMTCQTAVSYSALVRERGVITDVAKVRDAARWLQTNSRPGDIVFNCRWDQFPELFYWNQTNYYIGGMDPIFQYAYDPGLYWKNHHLAMGEATFQTWDTMDAGTGHLEQTYTVLTRDFKAAFAYVNKAHTPTLFYCLKGDARFALSYEKDDIAIFRIRRAEQAK